MLQHKQNPTTCAFCASIERANRCSNLYCMNRKLLIFTGLALAIIASFSPACKKPTAFGSELLGDEFAEYEFTDTITVECSLEREDSVLTSDRSSVSHFLCGEILNDPAFGKYSADIYSLLLAENLSPGFDTSVMIMDSIVLYLKYAPAGVYGDTLQAQTLQVLRLDELLDRNKNYYSNASLQAGAELGRLDNFLPKPHRNDSLFEGNEGAFLRIRLNDDFGKEIMALDSNVWLTDSAFFDKLKGLKIVTRANGASPGAMLAFDLNDDKLSRVALYYHESAADTVQNRFDFYFRNVNKFVHFEHDYSGSEAESLIDKPLKGEKMYVQAMEGLRLKVSFPYANNLNNIAVNKAQLVLTVADDNLFLTPTQQLIFSESVGDTVFNFTSDVLFALGNTGTGDLRLFGGFPEKEIVGGESKTRYRMTLSDKFQEIVDDDAAPEIKNRTVYINIYPRNRLAQRAVLYGPQSSTFPAKLELKYTKVE